MADTSIDERLSFAVITDPAGNLGFLRKAILELPYREFERAKKSKKQKVEGLEAIFVIGRLVDPLFRPEEARVVGNARDWLQEELEHDIIGYSQLNITDVPGLAHYFKHNAKYPRRYEQATLIPTIERLIGLKKDGTWISFGEAKGRIVEQYRQMNEFAKKSRIPVYFAADTIFLEQVIPEERWLHWKSLLFGTPQQQLIKTVGMTGLDFAIREYEADATLRGQTRFSLAGFEPLQGKITLTYGMPEELLRQLKESKQKIVIAGKPGLFEKDANPAEHYPGNLLFLERPLSMSFYSFGNETGVRVVYFSHNNKLMFYPESEINLREMSATAGRQPRQSDAEAAAQMSDMAADMVRILPILERQNPALAQKICESGFDRAQQLAHIIDFLNNQYETVTREKHDFMMQFVAFLDEIIKHAKLFEWYQSNKKVIYEKHGIVPGAPASHAVEMEVFKLGINTAKEALERREKSIEDAFNRSLNSIEELVHLLQLTEWYDEQKKHLSQKNRVSDESPAVPERVMEVYPLAITEIKNRIINLNEKLHESIEGAELKEMYENRIRELESIVIERDKRLDEFIGETAKLQDMLAERDKIVSDKERTINALNTKCTRLDQQVADRNESIRLQRERLDNLGDKCEELEEKLGRQVEDNDALRRENADLRATLEDYKALQAQLSELEKLARQLKAENPDITAQDIKGIFEAYAKGLTIALGESQHALQALQETLQKYERQLHTPITPDKDLQEGIRTARQDIEKRKNETIAKIIQKMKADQKKYEEETREKYEATKALKQELEAAVSEKDRLIRSYYDKLDEKDNRIAELEGLVAVANSAARLLSMALGKAKHYEEAIFACTSAIITARKKDPLLASLYFNRAIMYCHLNEYRAAIKDLKEVIMINPNHKNAKQFMGDLEREVQKKGQ